MKILKYFLYGGLGCWLGGLGLFYGHVIRLQGSLQPTDGMVIFTGSQERVPAGLRLFKKGLAKKLLISGASGTQDTPQLLFKNITLDYKAKNTYGNAQETAIWVHQNYLSSLRVVTSDSHMPRSLLELRRVLPHIHLIPYPLRTKNPFYYIFKEYHKFILTYLRDILGFDFLSA